MEIRDLDTDDADALTALYHTFEWWDDREETRVRRSIAGADAMVGLVAGGEDVEDGVSNGGLDGVDEDALALADGGVLLGSARVVTDEVYYARIYDVLLAAGVRGDGHDEGLVRAAREHPLLSDVDTITLSCREGLAPFYERCGFERHDGTFEQWSEEETAAMMYWQPEMDEETG